MRWPRVAHRAPADGSGGRDASAAIGRYHDGTARPHHGGAAGRSQAAGQRHHPEAPVHRRGGGQGGAAALPDRSGSLSGGTGYREGGTGAGSGSQFGADQGGALSRPCSVPRGQSAGLRRHRRDPAGKRGRRGFGQGVDPDRPDQSRLHESQLPISGRIGRSDVYRGCPGDRQQTQGLATAPSSTRSTSMSPSPAPSCSGCVRPEQIQSGEDKRP